MSSRPSKVFVMPGRVLGVTPETFLKRSAGVEVQRSILRPSAPAFQPKSAIPSAPAKKHAPGAIEAAKKAARNQRSSSTSKASKTTSRSYSAAATSADESASTAADPPADVAAGSSWSKGVRVNESKNVWKRFHDRSPMMKTTSGKMSALALTTRSLPPAVIRMLRRLLLTTSWR